MMDGLTHAVYSVRLALESDAARLAAISEESLHYFWNEKDFAEAIAYSQAKVYVCETDAELLGYVILYHAADEGEIPSIAVCRKSRRQGIGSFLLRKLMEQSGELGVRKIFLEVRESNEPAQRLYESAGFLRVGVRKNFYDEPVEDGIIMAKKLL